MVLLLLLLLLMVIRVCQSDLVASAVCTQCFNCTHPRNVSLSSYLTLLST